FVVLSGHRQRPAPDYLLVTRQPGRSQLAVGWLINRRPAAGAVVLAASSAPAGCLVTGRSRSPLTGHRCATPAMAGGGLRSIIGGGDRRRLRHHRLYRPGQPTPGATPDRRRPPAGVTAGGGAGRLSVTGRRYPGPHPDCPGRNPHRYCHHLIGSAGVYRPAGAGKEALAMSLLQTRHLTVERGGAAIVDDINLDIQAGELVMLVGPNGAGKSTLLQRLAGVQPLSRGSIHLQGQATAEWRHQDWARVLAFLPQLSLLNFPLSVREVVQLG